MPTFIFEKIKAPCMNWYTDQILWSNMVYTARHFKLPFHLQKRPSINCCPLFRTWVAFSPDGNLVSSKGDTFNMRLTPISLQPSYWLLSLSQHTLQSSLPNKCSEIFFLLWMCSFESLKLGSLTASNFWKLPSRFSTDQGRASSKPFCLYLDSIFFFFKVTCFCIFIKTSA